MDSYRSWSDDIGPTSGAEAYGDARDDDDIAPEAPPSPVGQDERRMQVRAYNYWAGLLGERNFPAIADLAIDTLPDFAPHAVLLDFSKGIENPAISFLGDQLASECGAAKTIRRLSDVPGRSLLSRITDHYMQILANESPIGFEAEFVNLADRTVLYRGILLPFANDDGRIGHILGVINWKELADQQTTDALLLEIDQALQTLPAPVLRDVPRALSPRSADGTPGWADGPVVAPVALPNTPNTPNVFDMVGMPALAAGAIAWPKPAFGAERDLPVPTLSLAPAPANRSALNPADMALADWLASARESAEAANGAEDRSRLALYAAIGRAWDFALAAAAAPADLAALIGDAGLTVQERAPLIPVVKLVFGAGYDKTRLTEFATALAHAERLGLARGALTAYLAATPGGLKRVVQDERKARRGEHTPAPAATLRAGPKRGMAKLLRAMAPLGLDDLRAEGSEFTLLVARRSASGVVVLGEVGGDVPLFERAVRALLG